MDTSPRAARFCLEKTLLDLFACRPEIGEVTQGLRDFLANSGEDEGRAEFLASKAGLIPQSFVARWVGRFAEEAVAELSPARVDLMCSHGTKGSFLALVEFFEFMEDHFGEARGEIREIAQRNHEQPDDLFLTWEALGSLAAQRLHDHRAC